ncbi:MAG: hypothetical protein ACXVQQ_04090, partial [Gaiellaceae bacterium]
MTEHPEGTHVGTQGDSPSEAIGLEVVLAVLLFFIDIALGYAVLTLSALYWIHRLPPLPWKLGAQAVLVILFLVLGPASFGFLL